MNKDPVKNPNFIRYLIAFSIGLLILWIAFAVLILPILPASLSGGLATLGYGVIFVIWALIILYLFEKRHPDEE